PARLVSAPARRAHACARPDRIRADPARSHRVGARAAALGKRGGPMTARDILFTRHPSARGFAWLKDSYAMFRTARFPWVVLLMTYYVVLLVADLIPVIGGIAAPLLKPVFAVGFLAAAWTQERGGVPAMRQLFQGFRSNLFALCSLGVVFVLGMMIAIGAT